jgi:hypothetical protein
MTSTIKVNNIQNQCGANIINENSNTITIGASGDTIALASGASQSGFGRTGTVDWQTGSIKTSTFTAANGEGYFINSGSSITANLPAGSAGAIVAFSDYARNFNTHNFVISPNGSEKIGGVEGNLTLNVNGQAITLVYVDSTKGWVNVQNAEDTEIGILPFIQATGGTITTSGNCKIHTFTGPGTFTVTNVASCAANNVVSHLVVAGGGGASFGYAGGGGAGGFREVKSPVTPYTASPLDGYPSAPNRVTVTATSFPITVGGGGGAPPTNNARGVSGSNSIFSTITSAGGGGGGAGHSPSPNSCAPGVNGGSGGGAGGYGPGTRPGGSGNTPPVTPSQGSNGGSTTSPSGSAYTSAGGGGATAVGGTPPAQIGAGGCGGAGATTSITASPVAYAGGGGGGVYSPPSPATTVNAGGTGGGGQGTRDGSNPLPAASQNGTVNTGGGAGGGGNSAGGYTGGSGIVIIRYKFQ